MEVRPNVKKVKVFDIIPAAMEAFAMKMSEMFPGPEFVAVASAQEAAEGSDIIITCTPSPKAFIDGAWLKKGCHVSAIGADNRIRDTNQASAHQEDRSKQYIAPVQRQVYV